MSSLEPQPGIRRIISEADDVGGQRMMDVDDDDDVHDVRGTNNNNNTRSTVVVPDNDQAELQSDENDTNNNINNNRMTSPVFVENEDAMEIQLNAFASSSTLSCDSDEEDERLVNTLPPRHVVSKDNNNNNNNDVVVAVKAAASSSDATTPYEKAKLRRTHSNNSWNSSQRGSQTSSRDWGWFEDVHMSDGGKGGLRTAAEHKANNDKPKNADGNDASAMGVTAPTYVLEESLSSQRLWKESAGQRPPQPVEERAFYEKMWAQNFARSNVEYQVPVEELTAASPLSLNPFADGNFETGDSTDFTTPQDTAGQGGDITEATLVHRMNEDPHRNNQTFKTKQVQDPAGEGNLSVLVRGDNVFGTTVSKSFARQNENGDTIAGVDTINISVASYRVVESVKRGKYAQFLVIYREGSIRDTVGIWKRYSHFEELAHKVTQAHEGCAAAFANISPLAVAEEPETEHLPNAITSWRLLKKRQRWYRCLDAGYLSLKVFLLERFLHDILFESTSPHLLRDFVGVDESMF